MQNWIGPELETSDFGDERLNARYKILMDRLSCKPSASIPAACGGWNETIAAYRFFENDRVDVENVLKPHLDATVKRMREHEIVLVVQDTTEIDVTRPAEKMEGAGPLNGEKWLGFYDHVMQAYTPEGVPLGVVDARINSRDMDKFLENRENGGNKRKQKPIEDKESFRWLESYRKACEIQELCTETKVVCVSDSEGDIYECLPEATGSKKAKAEWLVRACQDRSVESEKTGKRTYRKLWEDVESSEVLGGAVDIRFRKQAVQQGSAQAKTEKVQAKGDCRGPGQARQVAGPLPKGSQALQRGGQRDSGPGKEWSERRTSRRVVAVDDPADRRLRRHLRRDRLLLLPMADRNIFSGLEERVQGRGTPIRVRGSFQALPCAVHDRGMEGDVRADDGPKVSRLAVRRGIRRKRMEVRLRDSEKAGSARKAAGLGGNGGNGGRTRRLARQKTRRPPGAEDDVDWTAKSPGFRNRMAVLCEIGGLAEYRVDLCITMRSVRPGFRGILRRQALKGRDIFPVPDSRVRIRKTLDIAIQTTRIGFQLGRLSRHAPTRTGLQ